MKLVVKKYLYSISLIILVSFSSLFSGYGQQWLPLGEGIAGMGEVRCIASYHDTLYAGGSFTYPIKRIAYYDGTEWLQLKQGFGDTMSYLITTPAVNAMAIYDDELYFNATNHEPDLPFYNTMLYKYNGFQLIKSPIGRGLGYGLKTIDDKLFIGAANPVGVDYLDESITLLGTPNLFGIYDKPDGVFYTLGEGFPCVSAPLQPTEDLNRVNDFIKFQGNYFFCGEFNSSCPMNSFRKWNIEYSVWENVYFPMTLWGGYAGVYKMEIFRDHLYLAGVFDHIRYVNAESNGPYIYTQNLVEYDGEEWYKLYEWINGSVFTLKTFDDKLFIGGSFNQIIKLNGDTLFCNNIAVWDGNDWTTTGSGMIGVVYALETIGNKLYAGGSFEMADGVACHKIAEYYRTASNINSISDLSLQGIHLYPNPATEYLQLEMEIPCTKAEVYDIQGKMLIQKSLGNTTSVKLDLEFLNAGIYILKLYRNEELTGCSKFILKE